MSLPSDHATRIARARLALDGLSVGDAFGERFFVSPSSVRGLIDARALPASPWKCTDDTVMAVSIVDVLHSHGTVDRDVLALHFGRRYVKDIYRGYGGTAHDILRAISLGSSWSEAARSAFDGTGSKGNGGAMRAAPVGAYFERELERAAAEAAKSAEVTHAHPEGQAGAVAVAVAAAMIRSAQTPAEVFAAVLAHTPSGATRAGIERASSLNSDRSVEAAVEELGNGSRVLSEDTVPFCLWCVAKAFHSYEEALWTAVAGLGDRDTTCAIVGGLLSLRDATAIPEDWLRWREPLAELP
jgi:ADP-ribosylglycohydrolase